jgi:hypothetical protein
MRIEFELLSFSVLLIICFLIRMIIEMDNAVRSLLNQKRINTTEVLT